MSQLGFVELIAELRPASKCTLTETCLGSGAESPMGVFVGIDSVTGERCAVKRLRAEDVLTAKGPIEKIRRMRDLKHINLVTYYGMEPVYNDLDQLTELWLIMELCQEATLRDMGKKGLSGPQVVKIAEQVLSGLEHLHKHQIVHRDLKGTNVLIGFDGTIKLADFGISKKLQDLVTKTGEIERDAMGTWPYMPPEAVNDEAGRIGRSFDMWSFGCLIIEMVTSRPPLYRSSSTKETITVPTCGLFHIGGGNGPRFTKDSFPRSYSERHKTVLLTIVEACITEKPSDRPTAPELLHYIRTVFGKETVDDQMAALLGAFSFQERDLAPKSKASESNCFSDSDAGASALVTVRLRSFLADDQRMKFSPFTGKQEKPAKFRQLPLLHKHYVMMDIFSGLEISRFIVHYLDSLRTVPSSSNMFPCGILVESPDDDIKQYKSRSASDVEIGTLTTFDKSRRYDTLIVWPNESSSTADKLTTKKQLEDVLSIKADQLIIVGAFRTGTNLNTAQDLSSRCNWKLLIEDAQNGKRLLRVSPTALASDAFL